MNESTKYRTKRAKTLAKRIVRDDLITDDTKDYLRFDVRQMKPKDLIFYFNNKELVEKYIQEYE